MHVFARSAATARAPVNQCTLSERARGRSCTGETCATRRGAPLPRKPTAWACRPSDLSWSPGPRRGAS
eukprot:7035339-Pyramimonas_sp.AAC.1